MTEAKRRHWTAIMVQAHRNGEHGKVSKPCPLCKGETEQRYAIEGSVREDELREQGFRPVSREALKNGMTRVLMERGW